MKKSFISFVILFSLLCVYFAKFSSSIFVSANTTKENDYTAKSLFLMDYNTNQVLFENNSNDRIPVASIVKLMTIYLTCERIELGEISLDDLVVASEKAASMGGSQVFIESGAEYSVGDLLKSTIVSSANDASVALAETIAGTEDEFVLLMNSKAKELGLDNTNYVNCTGLPAPNQFSCAKDTAILLKEVSKFSTYHNYSTIWMDVLKHPKGRESELVNTNKLIRYYEGCDGGKTGSTNEAGYCLAATAKRNNMRLIAIVLGAENGKLRFAETSKLLNYGFTNFENKMVVDSKNNLENKVDINFGKNPTITVKPKESLYVLTKKKEDISKSITIETKIENNITAPINENQVVGKIYVLKDGLVVADTDIISIEKVAKSNIYDTISKMIENWKITA